MGRMKDQLIDAPCTCCGRIDMLTHIGHTHGLDKSGLPAKKQILLCDLCRCTNDSCEEERTNE